MAELSKNPVEILIRSDAWGTREILKCCEGLSREQFHKEFPIGLGSLHETLVHIISTMRRWTDRVAERPLRPVLKAIKNFPHLGGEDRDFGVEELLTLLAEAERDLLETARDRRDRFDTTVTVEWPIKDDPTAKNRYTFSRGAVVVHVCTHGFHHRAQCLNMLRHLGVPGVSDKLPDPSTVDWQVDAESPPVRVPHAGV